MGFLRAMANAIVRDSTCTYRFDRAIKSISETDLLALGKRLTPAQRSVQWSSLREGIAPFPFTIAYYGIGTIAQDAFLVGDHDPLKLLAEVTQEYELGLFRTLTPYSHY